MGKFWQGAFRVLMVGLVLGVLFSLSVSGQQTNSRILAVLEFKNLSGVYLPNIEQVACEQLSVDLAKTGRFRVVERSAINKIVSEQKELLTGLFNMETMGSKLGRLLGADLIATGAILSCETDHSTQVSWGITTKIDTMSLLVSVKVIDISTGEIFFADQIPAEGRTVKIGWLTTEKGAEAPALMKSILAQFADELAKANESGTQQDKTPKVAVTIDSDPSGADIEIDGYYVGATPLSIPLEKGRICIVRISRAGFEPWEKKVSVFDGLSISVVLQEAPPEGNSK